MPLEEDNIASIKDPSGTVEDQVNTVDVRKDDDDNPRDQVEEGNPPAATTVGTRRPETIKESETLEEPNAFDQLVKGWEAYMNNTEGASFEPLQMLQHLHFCGPVGVGLPQLTAGPSHQSGPKHDLQKAAQLRHTRSSPLQRGSSIYDEKDSDKLPPPIPLDITQRATSTPSSFRQRSANSAFGKFERGSFAPPPPTGYYESRSFGSAFDPVIYYATALEDMERTAIEVTDTRPLSNMDEAEKSAKPLKIIRKGAASRAARFLADVRAFPRRRRFRDGRDNPARPASDASALHGDGASPEPNTSVQVITEMDYSPVETSMISSNSELSKINAMDQDARNTSMLSYSSDEAIESKESDSPVIHPYQRLDSDVDEEELHYQRIEASIQTESPSSVPSPSYAAIVDDRPDSRGREQAGESRRIRIQVSNKISPSPAIAASPSPTQTAANASSVNDSPQTAHTSTTGSSGHTTQAASIASTQTGRYSQLSTISETDREVMEANKEGKLRQRATTQSQGLVRKENDAVSVRSNSTAGSNSTNPVTYLSPNESPIALREGANVPADRFFIRPCSSSSTSNPADATSTRSDSIAQTSNGSVSVSLAHTNSTTSSTGEPPKIVSYWEGTDGMKQEQCESSTERATEAKEDRESSPADFDIIKLFSQAMQPFKQKQRPDKFKYLPPRSPVKSRSTPSPRSGRGSVSPYTTRKQFSPPPDIVAAYPDSSVSKPYVLRTISSGEPLPDYHGSFQFIRDTEESDILQSEVTYSEKNVEVTQDSNVRMVTPEKEVSTNV